MLGKFYVVFVYVHHFSEPLSCSLLAVDLNVLSDAVLPQTHVPRGRGPLFFHSVAPVGQVPPAQDHATWPQVCAARQDSSNTTSCLRCSILQRTTYIVLVYVGLRRRISEPPVGL